MLATTNEVADALRVHPVTVRRMVASGRIPPEYVTKVGNHHRYNLEAIEKKMLERSRN